MNAAVALMAKRTQEVSSGAEQMRLMHLCRVKKDIYKLSLGGIYAEVFIQRSPPVKITLDSVSIPARSPPPFRDFTKRLLARPRQEK